MLYILLEICEFLNGICDHDVCFNIEFKMEEMNRKWWAMRVDWECEAVQLKYIVSYSESHKDRGNCTHRILSHDVHIAGSRIKHRPINLTMVSNFYPKYTCWTLLTNCLSIHHFYFIFFWGEYHVLMLTIIQFNYLNKIYFKNREIK